MLQEIIVYLILLLTGIYLLHQSILIFKPAKNKTSGSSCGGGSCSNCAMKIDFESFQPDSSSIKHKKRTFIQINNIQ